VQEIRNIQDVGHLIKQRRKVLGLTQKDLAGLVGIGNRFIVDLERGKETIEFGKTLLVLKMIGIKLIPNTEGR
jgi:HTH-type transcriptional regulator/antitoxin HipB